MKIIIFFTLLNLFPILAHGEVGPKDFAFSKKWLRALHYQPTSTGFESTIDSKKFFLSPKGKVDPQAELQSFIDGVRHRKTILNQPVHCAFPFRTALATEAGLIPFQTERCEGFEYFRYDLGTEKVFMVFVGQYADDPASLLGHLFLKFNKRDRKIGNDQVEFLDKTLNYAAAIPEDTNIFKYIILGIFGGFEGRYSQYEYSDLIEKYSNMEGRDIFSYELSLTNKQKELLAAHTWELMTMGGHEYFFFDENCAYQLLALIDAVTIEHNLTEQMPFYSAPVDVLKILAKEDLIDRHIYVPSQFQKLQDLKTAMTAEQTETFSQIIAFEKKLTENSHILVVEAVIAHINYIRHSQHGKLAKNKRELYEQALMARSKLGTEAPNIHHTWKDSPHKSHGAIRFAPGLRQVERTQFATMDVRPAFHDLLSSPVGFDPWSAVEIFRSRFLHKDKKLLLERLTLTKITKFKPAPLFEDKAWNLDFSVRSNFNCQHCYQLDTNFEFGQSMALPHQDLVLIGLLSSNLGDDFNNLGRPFSLGIRTGLIWAPSKRFRWLSFFRTLSSLKGASYNSILAAFAFDVDSVWDIRFQYTRAGRNSEQREALEWQIGSSF